MRATLLSSLLVALAAFGCSATGNPNGFGTGGAGQGGAASGSGAGDLGGGNFVTSSGTGAGPVEGCSEAATRVYVLSDANDLYSFAPDEKIFTKIGPLGCATSMSPNSMAVDRDAVAWVNYVENDGFSDVAGALFKVSTKDASCQPAGLNLPPSWFRLGMGFSSDGADDQSETLFVTGTGDLFGGGSPGLGRVDFSAKSVTPIGGFTGSLNGQNAELTGTGDGRLFGFFTTSPVQVAQIDKGSGAILSSKSISQVVTPSSWAFSFWGGDFYLYTSDGFTDSTVTRYRPSDGSVIADYMTNIGFIIVGAGVSTCAPLEPPK